MLDLTLFSAYYLSLSLSRTQVWLASPFVHIDDELGVSLLFRVNHFRDDLKEKRGEYHRFAAELEPVREQLIPQDTIQAWIPAKIPSSTTELLDGNCVGEAVNDPAEVKEELQEELKDKTPYELRSAAVEAFWKRDYLRAMTIFDELAKIHNSNEYNHVAMYQHGVAMWNTSEQLGAEGHIYDLHQRISWLKNAVELLKEASQHRNSDYSAKALYERSKALCRLSHLVTDDNAFFTQACEDAEKAANSVYERAYISWYQRLVERGC
ncbi:hypothetical protein FNW02_27550 [Komarekiella sp. 'clone 1']|uniref:Uncharacterized protein n=1 Tax=Komarekiella delphini-convector SJRDD-AB1 TaxID=2593771 RepID=A0AA40T2J0_9NOST|nr:hypothetical protein [Komarekiella delphini-convector SJRDD-AB1]